MRRKSQCVTYYFHRSKGDMHVPAFFPMNLYRPSVSQQHRPLIQLLHHPCFLALPSLLFVVQDRDECLNNKGRAKPWAGLRPGDDVRRSFARFRKCFPGVIARVGPEPQTTSLISSILLSRIAFLGLSGLLLCLFDHLSCGRCSDLPPSSCPEMTSSTAIAAAQSQYVVFSRQGLQIP